MVETNSRARALVDSALRSWIGNGGNPGDREVVAAEVGAGLEKHNDEVNVAPVNRFSFSSWLLDAFSCTRSYRRNFGRKQFTWLDRPKGRALPAGWVIQELRRRVAAAYEWDTHSVRFTITVTYSGGEAPARQGATRLRQGYGEVSQSSRRLRSAANEGGRPEYRELLTS